MYAHQAWADAEHWRAIVATPGALQDKALRERVHHIHIVQHAFLMVVTRTPAEFKQTSEYDDAALLAYARSAEKMAMAFWSTVTVERLAETVKIPWFKDPPLELSVEQALTQAAMHSHYHRGQNATRLRELGGVPPATDLVVWYWKGRPEPQWPEVAAPA